MVAKSPGKKAHTHCVFCMVIHGDAKMLKKALLCKYILLQVKKLYCSCSPHFSLFIIFLSITLLSIPNICSAESTIVPITWLDTVGVTVNGNSITKTATAAWGNGGAASLESFTGDGGVEFVASAADATADGRPMCGLSSTNLDASYNTIEYAIFLRDTESLIELKVYENGIDRGIFGTYQIGDVFKVERVGSTIVYKKNEVIFYTSETPTDSPLLVDAGIYNNGGEISDVKLFGIDINGGSNDTTPPATPTNLITTPMSSSQINLSWDASTDDVAVTGYRIYRDGTQIATTASTTFQDTGLSASTTYTYTISAFDASANESAQSTADSDTTLDSNGVPVTWVDIVGVAVNGSSITKTATAAWGNGGAASLESFTGDGGVEFVASAADATADGRPMCGLSSTNLDASYNTIEYAIFLRDTESLIELKVYENGIDRGIFGTYQIGDVFKVERVGSTIVYKKNEVIFYTSETPTDSPLLVDAGIYNNGGEISDVKLFGIDINGGSNDTTPPATPTNLITTPMSSSQINLSWDASTDDVAVTGYKIYRDGTQIATTASTTFQDTGLSASTTYTYTISAFDASANESAQSTADSDTTLDSNGVPVTWVDIVGVAVNGSSITKTATAAWGNGGAASLESFTGDGGVEFVASAADATADGRPMCGLSSTNLDASYNTIEYAIFLRDTESLIELKVYENGIDRGIFGTYQIGDVFKVERVGSTIVYKKNEVIFYTSETPTDSPLLVDAGIYNNGGEISDVKLFGIDINGGSNDTTPPATPTNLITTPMSSSQINLSWDASTDDVAVTGYKIYRDGTQIATTASTTFQDTGLSASTTYTYTISAFDASANESAQSTADSDTTLDSNGVPVTWVDMVGVAVNGNSITKTATAAWGNGGAASLESFAGDGGVEFVASAADATADGRPMCGLSSANLDASYNTIEYAIFLRDTESLIELKVYENGIDRGAFGSYEVGDVFKVERVGSTIVYKKNEVIFYTSETPTDSPLLVDASIYNNGGEISDVVLFGVDGPNNHPPVLAPIEDISLNEGESITLNPTAIDPDGDPLTYSYSGWMTSSVYQTTYEDDGVYTVTVTVSDGVLTDSQDVSITVNNVNVAPLLDPIADITVNETETVTLNPTASDLDGDPLTYSYSGWMTTGSYTTTYQDAGTYTVTVTASDGSLTDSQDVIVTVNNVNRPPKFEQTVGTHIDTQATLYWDPNTEGNLAGYKVYYGLSSGNYETIVDVGNQTNYPLPYLLLGNTYFFAVTAYDVDGNESGFSNETTYLALEGDTAVTVNEGETVTLTPVAIDPDGDSLTYTYSGWMTSNPYTTMYVDAGSHTVTVTVSDGDLTDTQDFTVNVIDINVPPVLDSIDTIEVNEGDRITLNPTAHDPDGDALTYSYSGWMTSSSYTTTYQDAGVYTVTVTASDGILTDTQDVTITVTNVNRAPILANISSMSVNEGETVTLSPVATDPDGDSLTLTYSGWMTASTYTTTYQDAGTYIVTVTASDGGLSDSQDVTITVTNVNRTPELATISAITVNEGEIVTINPAATDPDGDSLSFLYSGWMDSSSYTTTYQDAGLHVVTVTVSDGILNDTQEVSITVSNVNRAPELAPMSSLIVNEGSTINLSPTATDPDGDPVTYTYTGWMDSGSYTTTYEDEGVYTVTVTASDGSLSDSQDVTVTVINTDQDTLTWDAVTDEGLSGYKVYYGTSSGNYDTTVDVGNETSYIISGLISGSTHYFVVTAYDDLGNESVYSNEVEYVAP